MTVAIPTEAIVIAMIVRVRLRVERSTALGRRRGRLAGSRWAGGRRAEADRAVVTGCERARWR